MQKEKKKVEDPLIKIQSQDILFPMKEPLHIGIKICSYLE